MFQQAIGQLRGGEVLARDGRIGAVEDIYFDDRSWQVRYLLVATQGALHAPQLLISSACVSGDRVLPGRLRVHLSRGQLEHGAGAWPMTSAACWLEGARVRSGQDMVGWGIIAEDGIAGRVADLLVDDEDWSIQYVIVAPGDPGSARQILVPLDWLQGIDAQRQAVCVGRTREDLRDSPAL